MSHAERLTKEEGVYEKDTVHQAFKYAANMMAISVLQKEYMKVGTDKLVNPEKFNPMLSNFKPSFCCQCFFFPLISTFFKKNN
mgnify:CR=1 FL=1